MVLSGAFDSQVAAFSVAVAEYLLNPIEIAIIRYSTEGTLQFRTF